MNELAERIGGVDGLMHWWGKDPQNQHLRCLDVYGWLVFLVCTLTCKYQIVTTATPNHPSF